ncbi:MAG: hypothetical protein HOI90_00595 [Actinobacteria bacterium]|nr:hypothetical protein [Actinomycetota bacterium]MBT7013409.1 hypothetical protein [Actinomycetota bacterium]
MFDFKSSKKFLRVIISIKSFTLVLVSAGLLYIFPVPSFSAGEDTQYAVGYAEDHLVFEQRKNPTAFIELSNLQENTSRELLVDIYYPSLETASFNQIVKSNEGNWGEYIVNYLNRTWELSLPKFILSHLKLSSFEVETGLRPVEDSKFPIVIYSHGWAGEKIFASDQLIHLAAKGYVVISVDHTGLAMFTDLPSGIILNTGSTENSTSITSVMTEMALDIEETISYYESFSSDSDIATIVKNSADFTDVSIIGHSTGGGAAVLYCELNTCRTSVLQDPFLTPFIYDAREINLRNKTAVIYSEDWYNGYLDSEELTEIEVFNTVLKIKDDEIDGYYMKDARHYDFVAFGSISPLAKYSFLKGSIEYADSLSVNNYFNSIVIGGGIPDESYSEYLVSIKK